MRIQGFSPAYLNKESPQVTLAVNTDSPKVQEELAEHKNTGVRAALAEHNRALDIDVVGMLAEDSSPRVRNALARNKFLTEDAQQIIAEKSR